MLAAMDRMCARRQSAGPAPFLAGPAPLIASSEAVADCLRAGHPVRVRVQGSSMAPAIQHGEVLILEPVAPSSLELGDVIFYQSGANHFTCHRLLARRPSPGGIIFGFRGDAYTTPLKWVESSCILGKATHLDTQRLDTIGRRWHALVRAWFRQAKARTGITLGAWRRRMGLP